MTHHLTLIFATSIVRIDKLVVHAQMELVLTQCNGWVDAEEDTDVGEQEVAFQEEIAGAKVVTITNRVDKEEDVEIDMEPGGVGQTEVVIEEGHGVILEGLHEFLNDMRIRF